mmetsp:Transcript_30863/g.33190  ORF Transcript_30863/g.33190 Transcript_30863/m.33190 type:complete len:580 (-) Transcript_30863:20-1759(-)
MVAEQMRQDDELSQTALFISGLQDFIISFVRSKVGLPALLISVLISFGLGTTVGIVPEILSDRFSRLYYGLQGEKRCSDYHQNLIPEACIFGADDAQTGSAWSAFGQSSLIFVSNPMVGFYSDIHGRRNLLIVSTLLMTLGPGVFLLMQKVKKMQPCWYFLANAITGIVACDALFFASLSDNCSPKFRAGRFALVMAGFYSGFSIGPSLSFWMSDLSVSCVSFGLFVMALLSTVLFFPETLPRITSPSTMSTTMASDESSVEVEEIVRITSDCATIIAPTSSTHIVPLRTQVGVEEEDPEEEERDETNDYSLCQSIWECNDIHAIGAASLRPLRGMSILNRDGAMRLIALSSFLSAAVYSSDQSLVLFYIEEHLNVKEDDIAYMFFLMGILAVFLQGIGLQPLVYILGERGLLILSFLSGTLHNFLYGIARNKATITVALSLSQITKLNYPVLSSMASQHVGINKQGQIQGCLFSLNAVAGALGPIIMNYIYEDTKSSSFGPGTMFIFASFLYFLGTIAVYMIPTANTDCEISINTNNRSSSSSSSSINDTQSNADVVTSNDDCLEEPLLLHSEDSTIE